MTEIIKPTKLLFGEHSDKHRIDAVNSPLYLGAVEILRSNPNGKLVLFTESADVVNGTSALTQKFIESGMIPSKAVTAASLVLGLGVSEDRITDFKIRATYDNFPEFSKNTFMVANRIHAEFPNRLELHSEEHERDRIEKISEIGEVFNSTQEVLGMISLGNFAGAVERYKNICIYGVNINEEREREISDQMMQILQRDDILGLISFYGSGHSIGIRRKLKENGISARVKFIHTYNGTTNFYPYGTILRSISDGTRRISEDHWRLGSLEEALFLYFFDVLKYDFLYPSIKLARYAMREFGNIMDFDSFIESIEQSQGRAFFDFADNILMDFVNGRKI